MAWLVNSLNAGAPDKSGIRTKIVSTFLLHPPFLSFLFFSFLFFSFLFFSFLFFSFC